MQLLAAVPCALLLWLTGPGSSIAHAQTPAQAEVAPISQAAAGPTTANPAPKAESAPLSLTLHPGGYIWYAFPIKPDTPHKLEVFYAYLEIEASYGRFGFRLEPRLRDTRLRDYYPSNVWIQEAYAFANLNPRVKLKAGKLYTRFGMFWDGTFANLQFFDGLKLAPDNGFSLEGSSSFSALAGLNWSAQFFVIDGTTNGSLTGRDTVSMPGAHKRNESVLRLAPTLTWNRNLSLVLGASGQAFRADFVGARDSWVGRWALDLTAQLGAYIRILGEYVWQRGTVVRSYPAEDGKPGPGARYASSRVDYVLSSVEFLWRDLTIRGSMSYARYATRDAQEWFWHPGASYAFSPHFKLMTEVILWRRFVRSDREIVSDGVHVIANLRY